MNKFENLFPDEYFKDRFFSAVERKRSIELEAEWLKSLNIALEGTVCDVGCSTGEFLEYAKWSGERFGMEVNQSAIAEAKTRGVKFDKNITNSFAFFDVVIMRGVIQHLDQPYRYIEDSQKSLKVGGHLIILQTPNIGSVYYRAFQSLPALEINNTYCLPDRHQLVRICERTGLKHVGTEMAYLKTPYASPLKDFSKFAARILFRSKSLEGPFPGNMMNLIFKKDK